MTTGMKKYARTMFIQSCRSEESLSSLRAETVFLGGNAVRRKRGRPETTAEWRKKKEKIKLRKLEKEQQEEEDIRDPYVPPKSTITFQSRK